MISPLFMCSTFTTELLVNNKKLAEQIMEKKDDKEYNDPRHTFFEDSDYPVTDESQDLIQQVDEAIKKNINSCFETWTVWSHIIQPGEQTSPHTHTHQNGIPTLSWVYYVDVHEKCGDLVFSTTIHNKQIVANEIPQIGKLIVFPDWIPHYTERNLSGKPRISVSGNSSLKEIYIDQFNKNTENYFNMAGYFYE
jgi:hypothetical protein